MRNTLAFPHIHPTTGLVEPRLLQKDGVGKSEPSR